ncbi:MAG TPA: AsmA-like C-terminal region-containing protein [Bacteroidia bacterium]|nr:AsmA-like C-terminal region-containing protein [Bacteroidia bacterium]
MEEQKQEEVQGSKKRRPWWKKMIRFVVWTGGIVTFLMLSLVVLAFVFEDDIKSYVTDELNTHLNTTIIVAPENINLTFIKDFPQASVEFTNVTALDATAEKRDTLFSAGEISFSFSILDIFRENYTIRNISLEDGMVDVRIDKNGNDNYHFLKSDSVETANDSGEVAFALEEIRFSNVDLHYTDTPSESAYKLHVNDLLFTGDFAKGEFDLESEADFRIDELKQKDLSLFKGNYGHLNLGMNINTETGVYAITTGELKIAEFMLDLSGSVEDRKNNYLLDVLVRGKDVDIASAISLAGDSVQADLADIETTGEFYFEATIKGLSGDTLVPDIEAKFGIRNGATLTRKNSGVTLQNISLVGLYTNVEKSRLEISSFSATTAKSKLSGSFVMRGNEHPDYSAKLNGNIDLSELQKILKLDTVEAMSGKMEIHFDGSGRPAEGAKMTAADFRKFKTSGDVKLNSASIRLKNSSFAPDSLNGQLSFDGNNVGVKQFSGKAAGSDFIISGAIRNLLGYVFTDEEVLNIDGNVTSRNLDLNTLLGGDENTQNTDTSYELILPARLKMHLTTSVRHIAFRRFEADAFTGTIDLRNKKLYANDLSLRTMDGLITGSGTIDGTRADSLLITFNSKISQVNISKLFYVFENFGQVEGEETIGDKNVSGILNSDVVFASTWDNKLNVNENKIYTYADVLIEKGELKDFKPLESLSRFINIEELKDIKFNSLHNAIEIKNRVVIMPKMEIQSSAVDLTMSGTHDFDNMIDYHFVVSLDEIRARKAKTSKKENNEFGEEESDGNKRYKLYVSMKGPIDDPAIRYLDAKGFIEQKREEIKEEKQNLKQILRNEFGWFKKDSTLKEKDDDEPKDGKKKKDKGTINFKKGDDEEDAPEGDDF